MATLTVEAAVYDKVSVSIPDNYQHPNPGTAGTVAIYAGGRQYVLRTEDGRGKVFKLSGGVLVNERYVAGTPTAPNVPTHPLMIMTPQQLYAYDSASNTLQEANVVKSDGSRVMGRKQPEAIHASGGAFSDMIIEGGHVRVLQVVRGLMARSTLVETPNSKFPAGSVAFASAPLPAAVGGALRFGLSDIENAQLDKFAPPQDDFNIVRGGSVVPPPLAMGVRWCASQDPFSPPSQADGLPFPFDYYNYAPQYGAGIGELRAPFVRDDQYRGLGVPSNHQWTIANHTDTRRMAFYVSAGGFFSPQPPFGAHRYTNTFRPSPVSLALSGLIFAYYKESGRFVGTQTQWLPVGADGKLKAIAWHNDRLYMLRVDHGWTNITSSFGRHQLLLNGAATTVVSSVMPTEPSPVPAYAPSENAKYSLWRSNLTGAEMWAKRNSSGEPMEMTKVKEIPFPEQDRFMGKMAWYDQTRQPGNPRSPRAQWIWRTSATEAICSVPRLPTLYSFRRGVADSVRNLVRWQL